MDRISSIEIAIKNENSEMEYYLGHAKRSKNAVASAMFENLAEDEKEHMTRLKGLHEKLISDGAWPKDVAITVAGTNIKSVLDKLVKSAADAADHDADDIAALKQGAEFEQKGAKFYADLAENCDNPKEATFFRFLAKIEREHMISIQDSLFYLEDPEGWMETVGHAGLDGA